MAERQGERREGPAGDANQSTGQRVASERRRRDPNNYDYNQSLIRRARESGLEGPQAVMFSRLGREDRGLRTRDRRSQAAQDIMRQQQQLASGMRGVAAAGRGPFAGAAMQGAERAIGQTATQAEAQAAAADAARMAQVGDMMEQLQMQGEIQRFQEQKQREALEAERRSAFGGMLGGLAGAGLGALGFAVGGPLGAALGTSLMGAGGQFGGQLGSMVSDERMKTDIKDGGPATREMMDKISAKEYLKNGRKEVGVTAQDLEESKAGRYMVKEENGVKTIDTEKAFAQLLAGLADLNDRIKKVEKLKGAKNG